MTDLSAEQLAAIHTFLAQVRERATITREEWVESCQSWARGARAWSCVYGFAETDIATALWWYQHRRRPGSKEWRPVVILRALVEASERDYAEPELLPVSTVALFATAADKRQARRQFIRKRGVGTFYHSIAPILRRGGVEELFTVPATPETREYARILAEIVSGKGASIDA